MYDPDAGTIEVDGRDVTGWSHRRGDRRRRRHGAPALHARAHAHRGRERRARPRAARAACGSTAPRPSAEVRGARQRAPGSSVPPDRLVSDLSVGEAQRVEILKTLYRGAKILILDEPTAVLSPPEVQRALERAAPRCATEGGTVVLITHKLDEVMEISDAITVMRAGETVGAHARRATRRRRRSRGRWSGAMSCCAGAREATRPEAGGQREHAESRVASRESRAARVCATSRCAGARRATAVDGVSLRRRARARSSASPASRATGRPSWSKRSPACARVASARIALGGTRRHAGSPCASAATPGSRTSPRTAIGAGSCSTTRSPTT